METSILELALENGPWAALCVYLIIRNGKLSQQIRDDAKENMNHLIAHIEAQKDVSSTLNTLAMVIEARR